MVVADEDDDERRRRRQDRRRNAAEAGADVAEGGVETVAEGCLGCDLSLLIALTLVAGVQLLLWSSFTSPRGRLERSWPTNGKRWIMSTDKSGAGYGNHGGDGSMGGQDGEKSKDHEQGNAADGADAAERANDQESDADEA
jgi:hypothetical protein